MGWVTKISFERFFFGGFPIEKEVDWGIEKEGDVGKEGDNGSNAINCRPVCWHVMNLALSEPRTKISGEVITWHRESSMHARNALFGCREIRDENFRNSHS